MNGPAIFVLQDGTVPAYIVAVADPTEKSPPVFHLYAWDDSFGHAQESCRRWKIEADHAAARARVGSAEW